jgi:hypothetical protein
VPLQVPAAMQVDDDGDELQQAAAAAAAGTAVPPGGYVVPSDIAAKRAKLSQMEMEQMLRSKAAESGGGRRGL